MKQPQYGSQQKLVMILIMILLCLQQFQFYSLHIESHSNVYLCMFYLKVYVQDTEHFRKKLDGPQVCAKMTSSWDKASFKYFQGTYVSRYSLECCIM